MKLLTLVEKYNRNWNEVRGHTNAAELGLDRDDLFICPICLDCFSHDEWTTKSLSIEHAPPKKLGGKPITVTCRSCNNTAGTQLDSQLIWEQDLIDFFEKVPDTSIEKGKYLLPGLDVPIAATFRNDSSGTLQIIGVPKATNPAHLQKISALISPTYLNNLTITMRYSGPAWRRPELARLRIAYLLAFSVFGYSLILNQSYERLRGYLQSSRHPFDIPLEVVCENISDEHLGVNLIELENQTWLLIHMELMRSSGRKGKYAIVLPKPTDSGLDELCSILTPQPKGARVTITKLIESATFQTLPFMPSGIWNMAEQTI